MLWVSPVGLALENKRDATVTHDLHSRGNCGSIISQFTFLGATARLAASWSDDHARFATNLELEATSKNITTNLISLLKITLVLKAFTNTIKMFGLPIEPKKESLFNCTA